MSRLNVESIAIKDGFGKRIRKVSLFRCINPKCPELTFIMDMSKFVVDASEMEIEMVEDE